MTEQTQPASPDDGTADERDPLTTDDGLVAVAAAGMTEVEERDVEPGEDATPVEQRPLLDHPDLDVDDAGNDPCRAPADLLDGPAEPTAEPEQG